jgi:hypothetical protein
VNRLTPRVRTVPLLDTTAPARVRSGVVKALPFRAVARVLKSLGLAALTFIVLAATNQSEATLAGSVSAEAPGVAPLRGNLPPLANEHHQLDSSSAAMFAFEQAADEQPDEDPVLDIALDVAGWCGVSTRAFESVRFGEVASRTTQVVLRARPARGPPV